MIPANKRIKLIHSAVLMASRFLTSDLGALIGDTQILSTLPRTGSLVLGTHDGSFHCDEALALSMLKCLPEYRSASILRTRDPALLSECNVVVDVGAVYAPETHRYDHHQREFMGTLDGYKTRLSSAGLVYKHFGRRVIKSILESGSSESVPEDFLDICYDKLYKNFMEHIDAIDNGIAVSDSELKYRISSTLSNRVGHLNPAWNEPQTPILFNERFLEAMKLTISEFSESALDLWSVWWPARSYVKRALDNRLSFHPSGKIAVLETFCPWKDHLFELETEVIVIIGSS